MAEEIGFENGRNSNFQGLVTLTLTLDPAICHTIVHHSSTSTYIPNFIQIEETFCGRTDGRTDGWTDIFTPILLGRLLEVDLTSLHLLIIITREVQLIPFWQLLLNSTHQFSANWKEMMRIQRLENPCILKKTYITLTCLLSALRD